MTKGAFGAGWRGPLPVSGSASGEIPDPKIRVEPRYRVPARCALLCAVKPNHSPQLSPSPRHCGDDWSLRGDGSSPHDVSTFCRRDGQSSHGDGLSLCGDRPSLRGDHSSPRGKVAFSSGDGSSLRGDRSSPRGDRSSPRGDGPSQHRFYPSLQRNGRFLPCSSLSDNATTRPLHLLKREHPDHEKCPLGRRPYLG